MATELRGRARGARDEALGVSGDAVLCSDVGNGYMNCAALSTSWWVASPKIRVVAGCYHIQNVTLLHARYGAFIKPFSGLAIKNLAGYIRWLKVRLAGMQPAKVVCAS